MRGAVGIIVSAVVLFETAISVGAFASDCAPASMLYTVVTVTSKGASDGAFSSKSKTLYRLGSKYGRVEQLDAETGLPMLVVVNEPDMWAVSLKRKTGLHIVDPEPDRKFHVPVITTGSAHWGGFEFGCEEAFMKSVGAKSTTDGSGIIRYAHEADGMRVTLTLSRDHRPRAVDATGPNTHGHVTYQIFEWLKPRLNLFERPTNVRFTDQKVP